MTQEEKFLLLQDLCARLPYGVVVELDEKFGFNKGTRPLVKELLDLYCVEGMKPYLRPMSSMTEEEKDEYWDIINSKSPEIPVGEIPSIETIAQCSVIVLDWLNSHHFDYRGLIGRGLALEAPDGMYDLKEVYNYCNN